jgi:hypothetical protein
MSTRNLQAGVNEPLENPLAEALRLVELAESEGLQLRLMGGLAFHAVVPTWRAPIERARRDIDLATRSHDRRAVAELLAAAGYEPDRQYNALYGHKQLYFVDPRFGRPVDVLVDRLDMCHRFEFADRLRAARPTLPLAELLLSKLQVVKINRKDLLDALVLLRSYDLGDSDDGVINARRITGLTSTDWGWWRTVTSNLDRLATFVRDELVPDELVTDDPPRHDLVAQIESLRSMIDAASKSLGWKVRARVGDRVRWYEEPEEVAHGQDD